MDVPGARPCSEYDEHRLGIQPTRAADQILAANVGVTLFLITASTLSHDLSARARDATITSITNSPTSATPDEPAHTARQLLHELSPTASPLAPEETALLRRWLSTIADHHNH